MEWQWYQLNRTEIICSSLPTDNHSSILPLFNTGQTLFLIAINSIKTTKVEIRVPTQAIEYFF